MCQAESAPLPDNAAETTDSYEIRDDVHDTSRALVRRLVREQLRPQAGRIAVTILCMIVVAASSAATVYLLQPVLDNVFIEKDRDMLYLVPGAIMAVALLTGIGGYFEAVNM